MELTIGLPVLKANAAFSQKLKLRITGAGAVKEARAINARKAIAAGSLELGLWLGRDDVA